MGGFGDTLAIIASWAKTPGSERLTLRLTSSLPLTPPGLSDSSSRYAYNTVFIEA
jgi:hypothetical protein